MYRKITFTISLAIATICCSTDIANAQQLPCSQRPQMQSPRYLHRPIYTQPVYTQPVYSQPVYWQPVANPIVVAPTPAPARSAADLAKDRAKQLGATAKQQFRNRQYTQAKKTLDEVVKLVPNDASGWQFRGIVSFSLGDFEGAAADIYDAMRLGNTWPRKSIDNLYGANASDYDVQLSKLSESVTQKASMQGHFLLAYHHIVNERFAAGKKELQNVLKLQPEEPLSKQLLVVLDQRLAKK